MGDDLRDRVLAAVRKGLAGPLETSKTKNPVLRGYSTDSVTENGVTAPSTCNTAFPNQIKPVTPLHPVFANVDSQPEKEPAEPTLAYRATSVGPDGVGSKVTIVELPPAGRYRRVFGVLQLRPPDHVPVERWRQCVRDGSRFLARWGEQAQALNWSSQDLFGLAPVPGTPAASYRRLSRYDLTGLVWLMQGRPVVALSADTASIRHPTGAIAVYRRHNKPAYGPLGDSLDDLA